MKLHLKWLPVFKLTRKASDGYLLLSKHVFICFSMEINIWFGLVLRDCILRIRPSVSEHVKWTSDHSGSKMFHMSSPDLIHTIFIWFHINTYKIYCNFTRNHWWNMRCTLHFLPCNRIGHRYPNLRRAFVGATNPLHETKKTAELINWVKRYEQKSAKK